MSGPAPSVQYAFDGPGTLGAGDDDKVLTWNNSTGRFDMTTVSGGVSDHGALTGLADDDHSIYALLAGRSGGQTIVGGTASGDNLTLQSTSNATKGRILSHPITITAQATTDKVLVLQHVTGAAAYFLECLNGLGSRTIGLSHVGGVEAAAIAASGTGFDITLGSGGDLRLRGGASQNMAVFSHAGGGYVTNFGTKRIEWDATGIGFFAAAPVAKQAITGSRSGNAALADLLTKLALTGLITDSTSA